MKRILSGLKPTGRPHLGNYFGAVRQWIDLQDQGQAFYFLADLHALNQVRDRRTLQTYTIDAALDYLALGLDPDRCTLFAQSDVPEVSELMWILGTVTPMGLLQRAHAYKDALAGGRKADLGLFAYPVLMAADILLYDSDVVPVGKDQKQHIEITRDLAVKFNQTYVAEFDPLTGSGGVLRLPEPLIVEATATVPGTDGRKMSKEYENAIALFGSDKDVQRAIMGIVTDSRSVEDPKDPETCHVFALLALFLGEEERRDWADRYRRGGLGYGEAKKALLAAFHQRFDPARERRRDLARRIDDVRDVLARGARAARAVASEVLERVRTACGLGRRR